MDGGNIYDAVSDVGKIFSPEFRNYVRDENLLCRYTDGRSICNTCSWLFNKKEQQSDVVSSAYLELIDKLMALEDTYLDRGETCLVQFWKAEDQTVIDAFGKDCSLLTTRNQPFLILGTQILTQDRNRFCSYRMQMAEVITGNGGGGVIGRAFRKKMMEYTPSVGYYSYEEYLHVDLAPSFHIKGSLALPLTDSTGCLIGVLEVISSYRLGVQNEILALLWKSGSLRYLHRCRDICWQKNLQEKFHIAKSEIKEVMEVVGKSGIVGAQTWIVCNRCDSLFISKILVGENDTSYDSFTERWLLEAKWLCTLKKGEGIVGKSVASPHDLVYCGDVSQFSITEHPLAHFARYHMLSAYFAICLKSDLTGNQIYVLEFFLNPWKVSGLDLGSILVPILGQMRHYFRTFRLASGEKIGKNLSVQIIDARYPDKFEILQVGEVEISLPISMNHIKARRPHLSPHSIGDSSTNKLDDLMTGIGPYLFPHSVGESSTNKPDDPMNRIGPYSLPNSIGESSGNKSDDLMIGAGPYLLPLSNGEGSTQGTASSASTVQSKCWLTMNVMYGDHSFQFQLSSSSNLRELSQQMSQKLNLNDGTYNVNYLDDDDDSILITCDEDLRDYISCSMKQDKYTLMMQIEPK